MENFDTIKTAIDANIKTNGNQAITGAVMNSVLKQMVDSTEAELTELESKTDSKFAKLESEVKKVKDGEAYIFGETLAFRNFSDARIDGNTLKL